MAVSLGFASDAIVQEFYVDDDVDQAVREAIEGETGHPLVDVDYADVVDGAIVWWRADDAEEEDLAEVFFYLFFVYFEIFKKAIKILKFHRFLLFIKL